MECRVGWSKVNKRLVEGIHGGTFWGSSIISFWVFVGLSRGEKTTLVSFSGLHYLDGSEHFVGCNSVYIDILGESISSYVGLHSLFAMGMVVFLQVITNK